MVYRAWGQFQTKTFFCFFCSQVDRHYQRWIDGCCHLVDMGELRQLLRLGIISYQKRYLDHHSLDHAKHLVYVPRIPNRQFWELDFGRQSCDLVGNQQRFPDNKVSLVAFRIAPDFWCNTLTQESLYYWKNSDSIASYKFEGILLYIYLSHRGKQYIVHNDLYFEIARKGGNVSENWNFSSLRHRSKYRDHVTHLTKNFIFKSLEILTDKYRLFFLKLANAVALEKFKVHSAVTPASHNLNTVGKDAIK